MPKSSKRFVLSTSALNEKGFRMLTEGGDLSAFEKNPIMLFNHIRPTGTDKNQILPIGYWDEIKIEGDAITAVPVFDDNDPFAMSIYNKVEAGILRMCSAGAEPVELSSDPSLILPGQERQTVTKWIMKEGSIADIGANPDSLTVALYDENDKQISLSTEALELVIPKLSINNMADKSKTVTATAKKTVVKLADEKPTDPATTELAEDAPTDELSEEDKDAEIADLKKQLADALAKLAEKDSAMKLAEEEAQGTKCETLVSDAIKARKITLAQKSKFLTLAKADFKTTEELIKDLPVATSVKEALVTGDKNKDTKLVELSAKDWDELFKTPGAVDFLKLNSPDTYKEKFKAKFGTEPRNL